MPTLADSLELYMLDLINEERVSRGLDALFLETNLNLSAEDHSKWMLDTDIFSHTGVGNSTATQRIDAEFDLSGSWRTAENIAVQSLRGEAGFFDDVEDLHTSLMNSTGHRANILNPNLEYIGLGIEVGDFTYSSGREFASIIVTQNFASTQGSVDLDPGDGPVTDTPTVVVEEPVVEEEQTAVQSDTLTVTQSSATQWHTVTFDEPIEDAVIIMGPVSSHGLQPAFTRIQNVTENGFQFQIEEWNYDDGAHIPVEVSWMAASAGDYTMEDGRKLSFGATTARDSAAVDVDLNGFDDTPVVVTQVGSYNGRQAVTTRTSDVSEDGFSVRMQEQQNFDQVHNRETIYWMAIEEGIGDISAALLDDGVNHQWTDADIAAGDHLFADMQTFNGPDTAILRYNETNDDMVELRVQEEQSFDAETWHLDEEVGIVFASEDTTILNIV